MFMASFPKPVQKVLTDGGVLPKAVSKGVVKLGL